MSVQNAKDKKFEKRCLFLQAARKIFAQKGFQATNVSDIVSEVDSGQGTFYYHFKDKHDIFDVLMLDFIGELARAVAKNDMAAAGRLALADRELALVNARAFAGVFMDNMDLAKIYFRESKYVGGAAAAALETFYSVIYSQIENGLRMGIAAGSVRENVDPYCVARCFVGAAERVIYDVISSGRDVPLDTIAEQIVDFQSFGIMKRPAVEN
ncbi:MAG: TetR/AcrR family transcriptional regulator [bacterium]